MRTKSFVTLGTFLLCALAFGNTKGVLKTVQEELSDYVGNGDIWLTKYDVKKFDQKKQIAKLRAQKGPQDCEFDVIVGRRANFQSLYKDGIIDVKKPIDRLYALHKQGKIKTILSRQWDGASGDSEYCSIFEFYVYTTDGNLLNIDFQLTD